MEEQLDIKTIGRRSAHGILALISRQIIVQVISFVASLIVFTLLSKDDVGIFTAVTAMQRIISFLTDFGLGAALVQKKETLTENDIRTTFTIQSGTTFIIFCLVILFIAPIQHFFHLHGSASQLLIVLVFTIFLSSFKIIPSILLEREINFQRLAIPQILEQFLFYTLLIVFVMRGMHLTSYTLAFLISGVLSVPIYYVARPWKMSLGIDRKSLSHLRYGINFQAKNILATIKDDFLTVFLAKLISFSDLANIGFAQRLAFFSFRFIVDSVTKVTFSSYSRIQEKTEYLRKAIEKSLFFVSGAIFPILAGIIITAPYFVHYIPKWHNKWETALFSLVFFALNAGVSSLSNILVNVLDATGRVKTTLNLMIAWTILTWTLTPLLLYFYGYNGVSVASFLVTLTIFLTIHIVKKVVQFDVLKSIYKPVGSTLLMGTIIYFLTKVFVTNLVTLFLVIIVGGIVYAFSLYLVSGQEIKKDYKFIFSKL